jgi:hypothetical protein
MAASKHVRLSPSGPLIVDGVSGAALQAGDGSTGLVWRQQGSDPAAALVEFDDATLTEVIGLTIALASADAIPAGYHYDLAVNLWCTSNIDQVLRRARGDLHLSLEIEEDGNPGVWVAVQDNTGDVLYSYDYGTSETVSGTWCVHFGNLDLDRTASAHGITGVRVRAYADPFNDSELPLYSSQLSSLRIEQYVDD